MNSVKSEIVEKRGYQRVPRYYWTPDHWRSDFLARAHCKNSL